MNPPRISIPEPQVVCTVNVLTKEELGGTRVDYIAQLETVREVPVRRTPREFRQIVLRAGRPAPTFTMEPKWSGSALSDPAARDTIDLLEGIGVKPRAISDVINGIRQVQEHYAVKSSEPITIDPNAGALPEGWNVRRYGYELMPQYCQFKLNKQWQEGGEIKLENVKSERIQVGSAWIPLAEPYYSQFIPDRSDDRSVTQLLGGGLFRSPEGESSSVILPILPEKPASSILGYAGLIGLNLTGKVAETLRTDPNRIRNFLPQGRDMNHLLFPWSGLYPGDWKYQPDPCDYDLDFPPGTLWYPSNPAYQMMMSGVRYHHRSSVLTLIDALHAAQEDAGQMRVLCMNMEKKEPGPGVTYFPYRTADPIIPQLAKLMDESNFRGPWDQARLWIYTDQASLDEINKRVVAKLPPAAYVLGLADVDWLGGLSAEMRKSDKFVKPEYVAASATPEEAHAFLMTALNFDHPGSVGQWMNANSASLLKLATGDSFDQEYLTKLITELLGFQADRDRLAAIQFLLKNQQSLSMLKEKLGSGITHLYSASAEESAGAAELKKAGFFK